MKRKLFLLVVCIAIFLLGLRLIYQTEQKQIEYRFESYNFQFVVVDTFIFDRQVAIVAIPTGNFKDTTFLKKRDCFIVFVDSSQNTKEITPGVITRLNEFEFWYFLRKQTLIDNSSDSHSIFFNLGLKVTWYIQKRKEPNFLVAQSMSREFFSHEGLDSIILREDRRVVDFSSWFSIWKDYNHSLIESD